MTHSSDRARLIMGQMVRRGLPRLVLYVLAILAAAAFTFPLFYAASSSLKTTADLFAWPPRFIPSELQFANYPAVFRQIPFGVFVKNSVTVASLSLVGQILCSSLVAYGFAKFRFPGRDFLFLLVLSTLMIPREVIVVPLFLMFKQIGWLNTLLPLIIPSFFGGGRGAFFIFLMRQFFMTIPTDLVEAARIDGANSLRIFWTILMPLSKAAVSSVAIFAFIWSWNDFFEPLIFLNSQRNLTLPLGIRFLQMTPGEAMPVDNLLMAASMMYLVAPLIIFVVAQRYFVQGIVMSGIKG